MNQTEHKHSIIYLLQARKNSLELLNEQIPQTISSIYHPTPNIIIDKKLNI